ncbi:Reticulon-1-A [Clonorchis sinensis]|uniref:Reticulon-like protein n=2 Tax=Clonorchis sinensis TaxID=79923 RepID=A0A8T1MUC9_CLOSI|nr:Reticulon-1-A [Clonorchis sinensis]
MDFENLIQWRDPLKTGILTVVVLTLLVSLSCLSFISVLAYAGLALLCCTFAARLYHFILPSTPKTVDKPGTPASHDVLTEWLNSDMKLPRDKIVDRTVSLSSDFETFVIRLQRILLLKDVVDTAKFIFLLYLLTVLGSWFNLLTLIIVGFVLLFTLPKIYNLYQKQFDSLYDNLKRRAKDLEKKIEPLLKKLPGLKK